MTAAATFRPDYCPEVFERLIELVVDHEVAEFVVLAHFPLSFGKACLNHGCAVLIALLEARAKLQERRRQDENAHRVGVGATDLRCTLPVDFQDDVVVLSKVIVHGGRRCAVVIAEDGGMFEKGARGDHVLEVLSAHEMIVLPFDFAWSAGARGVGNGEDDPPVESDPRWRPWIYFDGVVTASRLRPFARRRRRIARPPLVFIRARNP